MWNPQQSWQQQKNKKFNRNANVSIEGYADLIFKAAFEAPFTALSQGQKLSDAFSLIDIAGYLQENVCNAWGKLDDSDLKEDSEYMLALKVEDFKLQELVDSKKMAENVKDAKIGYFKMCLLLKKIQEGKGKSEELEV
jgi:hypothetical protein